MTRSCRTMYFDWVGIHDVEIKSGLFLLDTFTDNAVAPLALVFLLHISYSSKRRSCDDG